MLVQDVSDLKQRGLIRMGNLLVLLAKDNILKIDWIGAPFHRRFEFPAKITDVSFNYIESHLVVFLENGEEYIADNDFNFKKIIHEENLNMPLKKGRSKATRNKNIKEVIKSYKRTGKIGTSKPKSKKSAIKQAVAIGYAQQRRAKKK